MAEQAETGDIGECMDGTEFGQRATRRVELGRAGHHGGITGGVQQEPSPAM